MTSSEATYQSSDDCDAVCEDVRSFFLKYPVAGYPLLRRTFVFGGSSNGSPVGLRGCRGHSCRQPIPLRGVPEQDQGRGEEDEEDRGEDSEHGRDYENRSCERAGEECTSTLVLDYSRALPGCDHGVTEAGG